MQLVTAAFCWSLALSPAVPADARDWAQAHLSPTKRRYLEGEPIGIRLSVANQTDQEVGIDYFPNTTIADSCLRFPGRARKSRSGVKRTGVVYDGPILITRIPGRETFETTAYLQRFVAQPRPGRHEIAFEIELSLERMVGITDDRPSRGSGDRQTQFAKGKLSFTVEPADPTKLDAIYAELASLILTAKDDRQRREACDALCAVESRAVVPYLFAAYRSRQCRKSAVEAMARLCDGQSPAPIVSDLLAEKDPTAVRRVLNILAAAKYDIGATRLRELLADPRAGVRTATRAYIRALNDKDHLRLLKQP